MRKGTNHRLTNAHCTENSRNTEIVISQMHTVAANSLSWSGTIQWAIPFNKGTPLWMIVLFSKNFGLTVDTPRSDSSLFTY